MLRDNVMPSLHVYFIYIMYVLVSYVPLYHTLAGIVSIIWITMLMLRDNVMPSLHVYFTYIMYVLVSYVPLYHTLAPIVSIIWITMEQISVQPTF